MHTLMHAHTPCMHTLMHAHFYLTSLLVYGHYRLRSVSQQIWPGKPWEFQDASRIKALQEFYLCKTGQICLS